MTQPGQFNDKPYRGRSTGSHKKAAKKGGGSGKATFGQTVLAALMFLTFPAGVVLGIALYLFHGYGVI